MGWGEEVIKPKLLFLIRKSVTAGATERALAGGEAKLPAGDRN